MKQSRKQNTSHHSVHPTIFIEQFLAVYLALQSDNEAVTWKAGKYLEQLLHRTKSAPIALTYTKEFLLLTTQSQVQLAIIRFISQLSDLSEGKSMQSSLSFIIEHSSFLTELRHNLTHRVMVKGVVIQKGRRIILNELKDKYWKPMFQKIWKTYFVDDGQVERIFSQLILFQTQNVCQIEDQQVMKGSKLYNLYKQSIESQRNRKLTREYLFSTCSSNYQFKSLIKQYVIKRVLPELISMNDMPINEKKWSQVVKQEFSQYFEIQQSCTGKSKHLILFSVLLDLIVTCKQQDVVCNFVFRQILCQILIRFMWQISKLNKVGPNSQKLQNPNLSILSSPIILKKLRQLVLLKFIGQYNQILKALPEEIKQDIEKYWEQRQFKLGKKILTPQA